MSDKIIGRFEPIGDDKGPKRAAFDVLTKEPYYEGSGGLAGAGRPGWQGTNASGFKYSVLSDYWRWVPSIELPKNGSERTKTIGDMVQAMYAGGASGAPSPEDLMAILYDAGYRKFEIVDGPVEPADGGSAFGESTQGGISVRDYFAAKALQGLCASPEFYREAQRKCETTGHWHASVVLTAFSLADAMSQERAK